MQFGHAVDRVAAGAGQVRHAHVALAVLPDQRHAREARLVAGKTPAHFLEKVCVDLQDDLQVPRQHLAEHGQRPVLQRFRQQRVVGVGEGPARDLPGRLPFHAVLVDQQAHELGHGDGRVGVVQLHREFFVEALDRYALRAQDAQHVLQRTGHEKVLLLEPQFLALHRLVVGIQHLAQVLGHDFPVDRAVIIPAVEHGEVE